MRASRSEQIGSMTLEAILVIPVLLGICLSFFWMGGLAYQQVRLAHATHTAARSAAIGRNPGLGERTVRDLLGGSLTGLQVHARTTNLGGVDGVEIVAEWPVPLIPGGRMINLRARSVEAYLP